MSMWARAALALHPSPVTPGACLRALPVLPAATAPPAPAKRLAAPAGSRPGRLLCAVQPVGHAERAGGKRLGFCELEAHLSAHVLEQAHPGPDHDRADTEAELIEQPVAQQPPHQRGAAGDLDVLTGPLLELVELGGDVTGDQARRPPP